MLRAIAAPHPLFWALCGGLVALDAAWLAFSGIRLAPEGFVAMAGLVAGLLVLAAVLGPVKSDPVWRGISLSSAALIAFTVPAAVLQYLAATLALPLVDGQLARAEALLGFDWPAYRAALEAHPDLAWGLAVAYHSSGPQIALVVLALSVARRQARLWAFVRLFAATLLCVILVSALLPAAGAYVHFRVSVPSGDALESVGALWHLDALARLRAGTMPVIVLGDIRGLATFPSFHVCLAVLTAWALAPIPVIGPLALLLNAAVAVATLTAGGHYLPDVLAGGALAMAALARHAGVTRRFPARRAHRRHSPRASNPAATVEGGSKA